MQSESRESLLNKNLKAVIILIVAVFLTFLILFRNFLFQSTYLLKSFGESSIDPGIAFKNDKPTFLEFYAEWCEVCKEMAPKVSSLKNEYQKDINFVFLNVDNKQWESYIRKFDVNGIPQVNLFDRKGELKSTYIGKQEESTIRDSIVQLERNAKSYEQVLNAEFSAIKENKNNEVTALSHG